MALGIALFVFGVAYLIFLYGLKKDRTLDRTKSIARAEERAVPRAEKRERQEKAR